MSSKGSNKGQMLQDLFLSVVQRNQIPVSMFLVNGIRLQGQVEFFDQYVVILKSATTQMVYKHVISTIVPAHPVKVAQEINDKEELPLPNNKSDNKPHVVVKRARSLSNSA